MKVIKNLISGLTLRDKFILVFVFLSLSALILMGGISWLLVNNTRTSAVFELEEQLVLLKIEEMESFVREVEKIRVPFKESAGIELEDQKALAEQILDDKKYLEDISFLGLSREEWGKEIIRIFRAESSELSVNRYSEEKYWIIPQQGGVYISPKKPFLKDQSETPKFQEASSGRDYIGQIYYKDGGVPMMTIAFPIYNKDGKPISVFAGELNISPLQKLFSEIKLGKDGYLFVADRDGNIFAGSNEVTQPNKNDGATGSETREFISDVLRGRSVSLKKSYKSFPGTHVMATGKTSDFLGWGVIAEWPRNDAMAIVNTLSWLIGLSALLLLIAIVIAASILANQITKPLRELSCGAEVIGKGSFNHKIKVRTRDEIGELGETFNKMARDLKEVERLREVEVRAKALKETLVREKQLSKLKDAFIAVASHQFRTPLSVIRWSIDVIRMQKNRVPITKIEEQIKDIFSNTMKLVIIADDLLTVAEFGLGKYEPKNIVELDIVSATKDIIKIYSKLINEKKIELEFKKPKGKLLLKVNKRAIHAAIKNLIDNAITYTREDGRVFVSIEKADGKLMFSVEDNGIGIPKKDQRYVFTQFFRASNAVEAKNVGTGLGLYIIKNIIEGHGGEIGLRSEQNKGSMFWFTLPLK